MLAKICLFLFLLVHTHGKLEMVVEIFRHGAREPIFNYWNADTFKYPGELTSVGMRQHFLLGSQLRKEYVEDLEFLPPNYDPNQIFVRSTDYNRTIMSALSQLYGLYPKGTGPKIPDGIPQGNTLPPYKGIDYDLKSLSDFSFPDGFQPIPIHTIPITEDAVLLGEHADICPINQRYYDEQHNSQLYKEIYQEFENNTIAKLKEALNITKEIDLGVVAGINDVFLNDVFANKPLPDLGASFFSNMTYIYTMNLFYTYFGGPLQQKFIATPLFSEILGYFDSKINNQTTKKWVMYSAHDSTLGYVYTGMNVSSWQCHLQMHLENRTDHLNCLPYPAFASSFLIELHRDAQSLEWFIKIKVNGEYVRVCERDERQCGFVEWSQRVRNYILPNYSELCSGKRRTFLEIY